MVELVSQSVNDETKLLLTIKGIQGATLETVSVPIASLWRDVSASRFGKRVCRLRPQRLSA